MNKAPAAAVGAQLTGAMAHNSNAQSGSANEFLHPPAASLTAASGNATAALAAAPPREKKQQTLPKPAQTFIAGLGSGLVVAAAFNPWDRALYISVKHRRDFLDMDNFKHPFRGLLQSLTSRTLSSGLYFPLFDVMRPPVAHAVGFAEDSTVVNTLAGNVAGAISGIILNPLTAIKFTAWSDERRQPTFMQTAREMWQAGGHRPFFKGVVPTVARDAVFGGVFAGGKFLLESRELALRGSSGGDSKGDGKQQLSASVSMASSMLAAGFACMVSSPLNYVRNIKYGTPSHQKPPTTYEALMELWVEAKQSGRPASFLQSQLRIGWGTLRVACGMSVGYELYERFKSGLGLVRWN